MKTLTISAVLFCGCLQLSGAVAQPGTLRHITATGDYHDVGVEITATAPIAPRIEVATDPDRLIVDLPDVVPSVGLQRLFVNRGKLRDIRVGLLSANPCITRVVLDLLAPIQYRLLPLRNTLVVNLGEEAQPAAEPIGATTRLPVETRPAKNIPVVVIPPPALIPPQRSPARLILPILMMSTIFAMLVIALTVRIQNKRMPRGL